MRVVWRGCWMAHQWGWMIILAQYVAPLVSSAQAYAFALKSSPGFRVHELLDQDHEMRTTVNMIMTVIIQMMTLESTSRPKNASKFEFKVMLEFGWTFPSVFLETHPCIVMNYGMCHINKGARLKRADICPNLYFFTFTIFQRKAEKILSYQSE